MIETFYTGTSKPERRDNYRNGIFFFNITQRRNADSGDFGAGVYFDENKVRAKSYGSYVFKVEVDMTNILVIGNAYDEEDVKINAPFLYPILMIPDQKKMTGRRMMTISNTVEGRMETSMKITKTCLAKGYLGIFSKDRHNNELVLFSNDPVVSFEEVSDPNLISFDKLTGHVNEEAKVINPSLKSYGDTGMIKHVTHQSTKISLPNRTMWIQNKNLQLVSKPYSEVLEE